LPHGRLNRIQICILPSTIAMPPCCKDSPSGESKSADPATSGPSALWRLALAENTLLAPVVTALLHGSCCWLPVRGKRATVSSLVANSLTSKGLLDLLTVGSASVATVHRLRPFLLTITVVLLADSLRRRGPTYRNIVQVTLCGVLLLLPRLANSVGKMGTVTAPTRSCH